MASGGARGRSGPAPDPEALRRDRDSGTWTTLPAEGRTEDAPEWPLSKATSRELCLWAREWQRPQAIIWDRNGQEIEVALYVRTLVVAEARDASATLRTLVRQQQEALGISVPGLARNRWRIDHVDTERAKPQDVGPSARDRFKVVTGGKG